MKRRRNAPISKRDKKALKRILRSHKGRGNRCNPKRRKNPTRAQKQAQAYANAHKIGLRGRSSLKRSRRATKWALKAHRMGRRGGGRRWLSNPKRDRFGHAVAMTKRHKHDRRRRGKWQRAVRRTARRAWSDWKSGGKARYNNPKRSRKWRKDSNAEPVAKKYRRKASAHGKRWGYYGNTSTARSRRWAKSNPKRSRKWRSGGTKMPALKREWKKRWGHGRRTTASGYRESSARSRRRARSNPDGKLYDVCVYTGKSWKVVMRKVSFEEAHREGDYQSKAELNGKPVLKVRVRVSRR